MSSTWGNQIKISVFGESHGAGIGVVLDGLPAGARIDLDAVLLQMARRAPGNDPAATRRRETDTPEILSGLLNGHTTGAPLAALIRNSDTRSQDYVNLSLVPRPGHSDFSAFFRYGGWNDIRGGGHFSGRLTAPIVFAGSVCRQLLAAHGVTVGAHLLSAGTVIEKPFDPVAVNEELLNSLNCRPFPTLDKKAKQRMRDEIERARTDGDSIGGIVECAAVGLAPGIGNPMFGGVENVLASILFGIPAVKGVEFGAGFAAAGLRGSENNDPFHVEPDGRFSTETNRHGGILGGITSGMPVIVRAAFKPTPSIARPQRSVELIGRTEEELVVHGRHDACVAVRAVPVVEAAVCIGLLDLLQSRC